MLENLVNVCCDTYHPNISDSLVKSLRSYIDSVPDYERRTPEFVTEIRRRLYFIHENNCQVAKRTYMYPRSRKFDKLLVRYVELEFEVLYLSNQHPQKQVEAITELRVLRLLQVMLYKTVLKSESLINENRDAILKKTVLEILSQVRSTYLAENKLVYNIINKLKTANSINGEIICRTSYLQDIHKNHATSDYGTDDDSDFENDTFKAVSLNNRNVHENTSAVLHTSDCMEVPLTVNGENLIPTVEFPDDDDDDNYMVYLQRHVPGKIGSINLGKRREKSSHQVCSDSGENSKISSSTNLNLNKKNSLHVTNNHFNNKPVITEESNEFNCIVICSDSDDDLTEQTTNNNNNHKTFNKKNNKKTEKNKRIKEKQEQRQGVVTFELIDDDDDDNETNYMVYLHKEIETNQKTKKNTINVDGPKEILISDSEDETVVEIVDEGDQNSQLMITEDDESINEESNIQNIDYLSITDNCNNDILNTLSNREKVGKRETTKSNSTEKSIDVRELDQEIINYVKDTTIEPLEENHYEDMSLTRDILQENMNIITFESEIELNVFDNPKSNFLINPAIIFEKIPSVELPEDFLTKIDYNNGFSEGSNVPITACLDELGTEKPNSPGGPVLSEKMDDVDVDNLLECRLNDSLLEEILLNDSYLLESQKEFEDLECFLFDDKKEPRINMSNFLIENDEAIQTEIATKNVKQVESYTEGRSRLERNKNYLFKGSGRTTNCHRSFKNRRGKSVTKGRVYNKRCTRNVSKTNPLKDFTNNNHQAGKKMNGYCDLELELKYSKHKRENSFKTCRGKSNAVYKR